MSEQKDKIFIEVPFTKNEVIQLLNIVSRESSVNETIDRHNCVENVHNKSDHNSDKKYSNKQQIEKKCQEINMLKNFSLFYGSDGRAKYEKTFIFKFFPILCYLIGFLSIILLMFDISITGGKISYYLFGIFISLFYIHPIISSLIIAMIFLFSVVTWAIIMTSLDVHYGERM